MRTPVGPLKRTQHTHSIMISNYEHPKSAANTPPPPPPPQPLAHNILPPAPPSPITPNPLSQHHGSAPTLSMEETDKIWATSVRSSTERSTGPSTEGNPLRGGPPVLYRCYDTPTTAISTKSTTISTKSTTISTKSTTIFTIRTTTTIRPLLPPPWCALPFPPPLPSSLSLLPPATLLAPSTPLNPPPPPDTGSHPQDGSGRHSLGHQPPLLYRVLHWPLHRGQVFPRRRHRWGGEGRRIRPAAAASSCGWPLDNTHRNNGTKRKYKI